MRGLQRALRPITQRLQLAIGRAVLLLVNDSLKLQGVQVSLLSDEVRDEVERFQQYGFTSNPHPGAEAIALSVAGSRDHVVVIAIDDRRYRLKPLQAGEVALYTDEGDKIVIKRGGTIEVTAATKVILDTPRVELTGDLDVAGDVHAAGTATIDVDVIGGGKSLKTHVHGGVQIGGGNTGAAGMSDVRTVFRDFGDWRVEGAALAADDGIESAVIISLFTDALDDTGGRAGADRRGWWGDAYAQVPGDRIGSRLWTLAREKQTLGVVERARAYAREALQWLIDDGVARDVTVVAEVVRTGVLGLGIEIVRSAAPASRHQFNLFWGST